MGRYDKLPSACQALSLPACASRTERIFTALLLTTALCALAAPCDDFIAEIDGRKIKLTGDIPPGTQILLSDKLLGLDEPVEISINGKAPFTAKPVRTLGAIRAALDERLDPAATPTAVVSCP